MLQTQDATNGKTSFSFEKDVTEGLANLWSAGKGHAYEAVDAVGESTLSYGAVADAAAEKDAAMLAANEAEKKVEAAVKALADAESEYNVLAQKIQNVESEKVEKGRELVNQSWIYNFLNESEDATKQAILQKKQSIATSSALNEEAKKQLAELAEKLEAAQMNIKMQLLPRPLFKILSIMPRMHGMLLWMLKIKHSIRKVDMQSGEQR